MFVCLLVLFGDVIDLEHPGIISSPPRLVGNEPKLSSGAGSGYIRRVPSPSSNGSNCQYARGTLCLRLFSLASSPPPMLPGCSSYVSLPEVDLHPELYGREIFTL
jgi:hypothetical protein